MSKTAKWVGIFFLACMVIGVVLGWMEGFPPGPRTSAIKSLGIGLVVGGAVFLFLRLVKIIRDLVAPTKEK